MSRGSSSQTYKTGFWMLAPQYPLVSSVTCECEPQGTTQSPPSPVALANDSNADYGAWCLLHNYIPLQVSVSSRWQRPYFRPAAVCWGHQWWPRRLCLSAAASGAPPGSGSYLWDSQVAWMEECSGNFTPKGKSLSRTKSQTWISQWRELSRL